MYPVDSVPDVGTADAVYLILNGGASPVGQAIEQTAAGMGLPRQEASRPQQSLQELVAQPDLLQLHPMALAGRFTRN